MNSKSNEELRKDLENLDRIIDLMGTYEDGINYYKLISGKNPKKDGIVYAIFKRWPDFKIKRRRYKKKRFPADELFSKYPRLHTVVNSRVYGPTILANEDFSHIEPIPYDSSQGIGSKYRSQIERINNFWVDVKSELKMIKTMELYDTL
jgi:hypothetical protein